MNKASTDIRLLDTTLRDGEQAVGVIFTPREKKQIASLLAAIGIPAVDGDLAEAIGKQACDPECNAVVLRNHGELVFGPSLESALRNAEVFELACRMILQGVRLRRFDPETVEALRDYGKE